MRHFLLTILFTLANSTTDNLTFTNTSKIKYTPLTTPTFQISKSIDVDPSAQGGKLKKWDKNDPHRPDATILDFKVSTTDLKNNTWTCLRFKFSMTISLFQTFSNGSVSQYDKVMTDETTFNEGSTCNVLYLNFENDGNSNPDNPDYKPATIRLQFSIQQSVKEYDDNEIYYLESINLNNLYFGKNATIKAESKNIFIKQGPVPSDADNSTTFTPLEADLTQSFKCYFGFHCKTKNLIPNTANETIKISFSKVRIQLYPKFDTDASNEYLDFKWKPTFTCDADISLALPIIVGVGLACIVIFTIVGYIIAKRKSSYAYEEL